MSMPYAGMLPCWTEAGERQIYRGQRILSVVKSLTNTQLTATTQQNLK